MTYYTDSLDKREMAASDLPTGILQTHLRKELLMDTINFISQSMEQVQLRLVATCEGLSKEQVLWRPMPRANNIGFILWHMGRADDSRITRLSSESKDLWETDGWYQRFGQPVDSPDPGDRQGLRELVIPELDVLLAYIEATHGRYKSFLEGISLPDLDSPVEPSRPQTTIGVMLRHGITHKNNHHGQIDYIRGLQEEEWDLPRGTGVVLP